MRVFRTKQPNSKFHTSEDCVYLLRSKNLIEEVALSELQAPEPCRVCEPGYPTIKVVHRRCATCNTGKTYPCRHNGGVRVIVPVRSRGFTRTKYVWPEQVHHYELAEPAIQV